MVAGDNSTIAQARNEINNMNNKTLSGGRSASATAVSSQQGSIPL
jgi:hypothetical protein